MKIMVECLALFLLLSCNSESKIKEKSKMPKDTTKAFFSNNKPGATFNDTLFIKKWPIVIFYNPDTAQLERIKLIKTAAEFQSQSHEYFFQMRNAGIVMKRDWSHLKKVVTQHARFIAFVNKQRLKNVVDLNTLPDFSGMILWDGLKQPHAIDMMNVDTELSYYFTKK